ncbi:hypothetical protein PMAYCL1PPCAC_15001 [Pristionchus mayeri]|uniref:Uncharacterized protein n=1 Tax=Pristionchus mayeri TaxID=1317129 RepID=A0AAN5HY48_9BILA|nr:hypothetical protein PMAYCL1PPCAC_15001 [Pristionchus mayeri]
MLHLLLLIFAPPLAHSLKCWIGWQNWNDDQVIDNVHLAECGGNATCCAFVTSLNGNHFGCHETCPPRHYRQCGPDPRSGVQDLRYCYCRTHHDPRCTPFLEPWDSRSKLTTPMPPPVKRTLFKHRFGMKKFALDEKSMVEGVKIAGPPAPPSIQPLPPGIRPPGIPISAAPPGSGKGSRGRRPVATKLVSLPPPPPSGKPARTPSIRPVKKANRDNAD